MPPAFYLAPDNWSLQQNHTYLLEDVQEIRHLSNVLRLNKKDEIYIFDGQGRQALCSIEKINKRSVALSVLKELFFPKPDSLAIMALAWSKATRRGFFMEKAVELGVHEVWLWQGEHSQGKLPLKIKEHWQEQCIAAMKQCRNPWLPRIRMLKDGVQELIEESQDIEYKFLPWEKQDNIEILCPNLVGKQGKSIYVIGPEGGFSQNEIMNLTTHNFKCVSLGPRVLRCETAALLCLGIHWWSAQLNTSVG